MTDKYNPPSGSGTDNNIYRDSTLDPTAILYDESGNVIKAVTLDANNQAIYRMPAGGKGGQTLSAQFSGGNGYGPGGKDTFTQHVGGSGAQKANTVDRIVAGDGVYISSPNGRGTVTISTKPISTNPTTKLLTEVTWSETAGADPGDEFPGEFIVIGDEGICMRSRDGENWTKVTTGPKRMNGGTAQRAAFIPNGHIEFFGVGLDGFAQYGNSGSPEGDGITKSGQLSDQNGAITRQLIDVYAFYNGGTATRGASTSTSIAADFVVITYQFTDGSDLDTRTYMTSPGAGDILGWSNYSSYSTFMTWGGDNTGVGKESVLIDLAKFKQTFPSATSITVNCNAGWYGNVGSNPVSVSAVLYKGGTMSKGNYTWTNSGASQTTQIASQSTQVAAVIESSTDMGAHIANFHFDLQTNTGSFN